MARSTLSGNKTLSNIFIGAAIVLIFVVVKYQARFILKTDQAEHWEQRYYDKLSMMASDTVVGLRQQGLDITLDRWKAPRSSIQTKSWRVGSGVSLSSVKIDPEVSYAAWPEGNWVEIRDLGEPDRKVQLPAMRGRPLDMGFLQGGSLVVLYSDSTMARWRVSDRKLLSTEKIPLGSPDQVAAEADYIAAASSSEGKLMLYRASDSERLHVVEEQKCPPPPFDMVIPGHGQVALLTAGGIFLNGETLNTPGRVRALAFGSHGDLLAAGDFSGIYSVPKTEKAFKIADTAPNGALAANEEYMIYSSAEGTKVFSFGSTVEFSQTGRSMMWALGGLVVVIFLLALDRMMFGFKTKTRTVRRKAESGAMHEFPDPPEDLVEAAASCHLVLWAGSGLSAQAGMPTRSQFIKMMLESGRVDSWMNSRDAAKLQQMYEAGEHEEVLNTIVEERSELRSTLVNLIKSIYPRKAFMARALEELKRIPFASAVTGNWDLMLEQLEGPWPHNVLHLKNNLERDQVRLDRFHLIKLYGDMLRPHTLLVSRNEMLAQLKEPGGLAPVIQRTLATSPVLFLGYSLDSILRDLNAFNAPKGGQGTYWAVTSVNDDTWRKKAAELENKYGVQVMVCDEVAMAKALPEFMRKFADRTEELGLERARAARQVAAGVRSPEAVAPEAPVDVPK